MKKENIKLWSQDEYNYSMAFGFVPNLTQYIHEDNDLRDFVMVVPGGAYAFVSETEGEIVANEFYKKGYNVGVLTYTTNVVQKVPLETQPLKDISRAVRYIRANNKNSKVAICGFSAGGHLCASLAVHYNDIVDEKTEYADISNRPDACILSYPVITSGEFTHSYSIENLIGSDAFENKAYSEKLEYYSLEKQVDSNTPPCFIWHTATDYDVPVENSLLFAEALRRNKVSVGLHIYSMGGHGLSLSNEKWARGEFGEPYTLEQTLNTTEAIKNDVIPLEASAKENLLKQCENFVGNGEPVERIAIKEVASWIGLAFDWLEVYL